MFSTSTFSNFLTPTNFFILQNKKCSSNEHWSGTKKMKNRHCSKKSIFLVNLLRRFIDSYKLFINMDYDEGLKNPSD